MSHICRIYKKTLKRSSSLNVFALILICWQLCVAKEEREKANPEDPAKCKYMLKWDLP